MAEYGLEVNDKISHAFAYFVLSINSLLVFGMARVIYVLTSLLIYGLIIELLQGMIPGRFCSALDILANGVGIMTGWAILYIFGIPIRRQLYRLGISVKN